VNPDESHASIITGDDWRAKCDVTQEWNEFSRRFDEINQSVLLNNYCTPSPTCHLRGDTLPHLFRRHDLTQIAFLKSITVYNTVAVLNFYYRIRFRIEWERGERGGERTGIVLLVLKICTNNFDESRPHNRLLLINVQWDWDLN